MNVIRDLRIDKKISKQQTAITANMSRPTYDKKERNEDLFVLSEIKSIAKLFDISYMELALMIIGEICPHCGNEIKYIKKF